MLNKFTWFLTFIICLSWLLKKYLNQRKFHAFSQLQSGPKPYPILGNVPMMLKENTIEGLCKLKKAYSLPCNLWIWTDYYYVTDNPKEIKIFLSNTNKSFKKAPFYNDLIKVIMGDTFIMATEVEKWRSERKIVAKAFAPSMWSNYTPVFHQKANNLLKKLEEIDNTELLIKMLNRNTFEIFMENFMGIKMQHEEDQIELLSALTQTIDMLAERSTINSFLPYWFYKRFTKEGKQFYGLMDTIGKRLKLLISKKRDEMLSKKGFTENIDKLILIESLLLRENSFSNNDIFYQILIIYFTSIDTSVLTLAFALILLGANPDIQDKAYEEVIAVVGEEREITPKDLSNLKFLEQCISETIRLYPIVPLIGRHVGEDTDLGSKVFPEGGNVIIAPYLVHKNENYWLNPEKFDPERFSKENVQKRVPGSYIPFLMGPRDCLGRYYSVAQVKVMTANVLRKYKIYAHPNALKDLKFKFYMVMKPEVNLSIKFTSRIKCEIN